MTWSFSVLVLFTGFAVQIFDYVFYFSQIPTFPCKAASPDGVEAVDGIFDPPSPIPDQSEVPVSPTSPTHPNFYRPPGDSPTTGVRRSSSETKPKELAERKESSPNASSSIPINLVLRLR